MSYWELWDNFSKVQENWEESRNLIYYLIEFLQHKSEVEHDYASGLARLSRAALFNHGKNTIEPSLRRLQSFCSQKRESVQNLATQQLTDLIPCLKELLSLQDEVIKTKMKNVKGFESELRKHETRIKRSKEKYFEACQESEVLSKQEEDKGKRYFEAVEEGNKFLKHHEEMMKPLFGIYQNHDELKYRTVQDTLRKLVIFQMSCLRSVQYDLESMPVSIDSINPATETKKFISDNFSKALKSFSVEVHPKRLNQEGNFSKSSGETLEKILAKCWKGVQINDEDNKHFTELVSSTEGRQCIINNLNEKKGKSEFSIPSCTFGIVCGLFSIVLDKTVDFQDFICARQVLFLSQVFYEETLTQKTFLHQILLTHPLWEDFKVWSKIIITSVEIEMEGDAKICAEDMDSFGHAMKLGPVLSNKVANYVQQMRNFMVEGSVVEKVLKLIQEYYGFSAELLLKVKEVV